MEDRVVRAFYWSGLAAAVACFACMVVFITVAAPGFNVLKDRARVEQMLNPSMALG